MNYIQSTASFNNKGDRRFSLIRRWDAEKPWVMFIGLNPSTANAHTDDPTIRRVVRFAKDWGYGGVYMLNLYSKVTPNPEDLEKETPGSFFKNLVELQYYADRS